MGLPSHPDPLQIVSAGLLAGGFATPLAAAAALTVLVNAAAVNAARGWASSVNGAEYPVTLGLVVAGLAFTGPDCLLRAAIDELDTGLVARLDSQPGHCCVRLVPQR